jgi:hypothetical protein
MSELESSYGPADLDPDRRFRATADDAAGATVDAAGATVDAVGAAEAVAVGGAVQAEGAPVTRNWLASVALSFAALAIVVVAILGVLVVT